MTAQILFLNGEFLPSNTAGISPNDRGFLLGDGLFETLRCHQGKALMLKDHWHRFSNGTKQLKIDLPVTIESLGKLISQLLSRNHLDHCETGVRVTLTRGSGDRGISPSSNTNPTLLITCFPLPQKKNSISLTLSNLTINEQSPLRAFKSLAYTEKILARQQAMTAGFDDALLCNTREGLVSATSANIFLVIDGDLHTPALDCGALPGVMRAQVIKIATQKKIIVHERTISTDDLNEATEIFLTSALVGILPVKQYEKKSLMAPGEMSQRLQALIPSALISL